MWSWSVQGLLKKHRDWRFWPKHRLPSTRSDGTANPYDHGFYQIFAGWRTSEPLHSAGLLHNAEIGIRKHNFGRHEICSGAKKDEQDE